MDNSAIDESSTMVLKLWENLECLIQRINLEYVKVEKVNRSVWKMVLLFHKSIKL